MHSVWGCFWRAHISFKWHKILAWSKKHIASGIPGEGVQEAKCPRAPPSRGWCHSPSPTQYHSNFVLTVKQRGGEKGGPQISRALLAISSNMWWGWVLLKEQFCCSAYCSSGKLKFCARGACLQHCKAAPTEIFCTATSDTYPWVLEELEPTRTSTKQLPWGTNLRGGGEGSLRSAGNHQQISSDIWREQAPLVQESSIGAVTLLQTALTSSEYQRSKVLLFLVQNSSMFLEVIVVMVAPGSLSQHRHEGFCVRPHAQKMCNACGLSTHQPLALPCHPQVLQAGIRSSQVERDYHWHWQYQCTSSTLVPLAPVSLGLGPYP